MSLTSWYRLPGIVFIASAQILALQTPLPFMRNLQVQLIVTDCIVSERSILTDRTNLQAALAEVHVEFLAEFAYNRLTLPSDRCCPKTACMRTLKVVFCRQSLSTCSELLKVCDSARTPTYTAMTCVRSQCGRFL